MKNKILLLIGILVGAFSFSSCLKDDVGEDWTDSLSGKMYAQFPKYGLQSYTISTVPEQTFSFLVNIATDAVPSADITVSLEVDKPAFDSWLAADTNRKYVIYPDITIVNPQIIIKKGTRNAYVSVKLKGADGLSTANKYVVPISIKSVSSGVTIASNMKTVYYAVPIANKYEGDYLSTGYIYKVTGWYRDIKARKKHMATIDINTVEVEVGDIGAYMHITVDPTNNSLTLVNVDAPNDLLFNTAAVNIGSDITDTGDSYYDPATKTFYLYYYYIGSGSLPRVIKEVIVHK